MYWEKVFGEDMLKRVESYVADMKMSISSFVRMAVHDYLNGKGY